jgi:hypothetical protein
MGRRTVIEEVEKADQVTITRTCSDFAGAFTSAFWGQYSRVQLVRKHVSDIGSWSCISDKRGLTEVVG